MSRELTDERLRKAARRMDDIEARDDISFGERAALDELFGRPEGLEILLWEASPEMHVAAAQVVAGLRSPEEAASSLAGDVERAAFERRIPALEAHSASYLGSVEAFEL